MLPSSENEKVTLLPSSSPSRARIHVNGQEAVIQNPNSIQVQLEGPWFLIIADDKVIFKCHRATIFALQHQQNSNVQRWSTFGMAAHCFQCISLQYSEHSQLAQQLQFVQTKVHFGLDVELLTANLGNVSLAPKRIQATTMYPEDGDWLDSSCLRLTMVNKDYKVCPTYPTVFACPREISDAILRHAAKYRSRSRLPIFSYRHPASGGVLFRSAQALAGLGGKRSVQDERLVGAIRQIAPRRQLMIVDARTPASAYLNAAMQGAGRMPLEHYRGCERCYLEMGNIHAVRDAYLQAHQLDKRGDGSHNKGLWIKHYDRLMRGVQKIVRLIANQSENNSTDDNEGGWAVLVHCSDGWDRTSQLVSLAQICLHPRYRTIKGLICLIEREWIHTGHQFDYRLARHLSINQLLAAKSSIFSRGNGSGGDDSGLGESDEEAAMGTDEVKEFSPIFPQFLDALKQLMRVYESAFEFTPLLIEKIEREAFIGQYATFRGNCDRERRSVNGDLELMTTANMLPLPASLPVWKNQQRDNLCFWEEVLTDCEQYLNPNYHSITTDDNPNDVLDINSNVLQYRTR